MKYLILCLDYVYGLLWTPPGLWNRVLSFFVISLILVVIGALKFYLGWLELSEAIGATGTSILLAVLVMEVARHWHPGSTAPKGSICR